MNTLTDFSHRLKGWLTLRWPRFRKTWGRALLLLVALLFVLNTSTVPPADYFSYQIGESVTGLRFDLIAWEIKSVWIKLAMEFAAPQDTLTETQRHDLVITYMEGIRRTRELQWQIDRVYSEYPGEQGVEQAAPFEQELRERRAWLSRRQNMVEGILEEQTSNELEAEGFGLGGYVWPPVKLRFTPLPYLLVVSSRAEITRDADIHLKAGLSKTEQVALEERVDRRFEDKRSLATAIGGLSAFPAMILETDSLVWLADTFAHEWTHHFLMFHPLGYNYFQSGEMTTLNETTASIVGREVGRRMILRYYPDLADRLPDLPELMGCAPMSSGELVYPEEPPATVFDFGREMRETRLFVDRLLAEGRIAWAEAYMEERRQMFVDQGYIIRKINQPYFAFYGSYAVGPSATNPIGGQLSYLRGQSESLRDYVRFVSRIDHYDQLYTQILPDACAP